MKKLISVITAALVALSALPANAGDGSNAGVITVEAEDFSAFRGYNSSQEVSGGRDDGAHTFGGSYMQDILGSVDAFPYYVNNGGASNYAESGDGLKIAVYGTMTYSVRIRRSDKARENNGIYELTYTVNAAEAGTYSMDLYGYVFYSSNTINMTVNGQSTAVSAIVDTNGRMSTTWSKNAGIASFGLNKGSNTLVITSQGQLTCIDKFTLTKTGAGENAQGTTVDDINGASAYTAEKLLKEDAEESGFDPDVYTDGLLVKKPVYARLVSQSYETLDDVYTAFVSICEEEKAQPHVRLYNANGDEVDTFVDGDMTVMVNHGKGNDGVVLCAALYKDGRLYKTGIGVTDAQKQVTYIELPCIIAEGCSFKLFSWTSVNDMQPAEDWMAQKAEEIEKDAAQDEISLTVQAEEFTAYKAYGSSGTALSGERDEGAYTFDGKWLQSALGSVDAFPHYVNSGGATQKDETGAGIKIASWGTMAYSVRLRAQSQSANVTGSIYELTYNVNAPIAGNYKMDFYGYTGNSGVYLYVNGIQASSAVAVSSEAAWTEHKAALNLALIKGENIIKLTLSKQNAAFDRFTLTCTDLQTEEPDEPDDPVIPGDPSAEGANVYVSVSGNDENSGLISTAPVKTVERASEIARSLRAAGNIPVVYISGGRYPVSETLKFTQEDSGKSENERVIYRGSKTEETVLFAGIPISGWKYYKNGIYKTSASAQAIREFYVNGEPQRKAAGEARFKAVSASAEGVVVNNSDLPSAFLANAEGTELVFDILWLRHIGVVTGTRAVSSTQTMLQMASPWNREYANMSKVNNTRPCESGSYSTTKDYCLAQNSLSLLDEPGEFWFDKSAGELYYMPHDGVDLASADCFAGGSGTIMSLEGKGIQYGTGGIVRYMNFEDIVFEGSSWLEPENSSFIASQTAMYMDENGSSQMMPAVIDVNVAQNIVFDNITVRNIGTAGIDMDSAVKNCVIKNSDIHNTGSGAIRIGNVTYTDSQTYAINNLMPTDLTVENCEISNISYEYASCPAITVYQAANINIEHNTIDDCAYSGISLGWGWNAATMSNTINSGGHTVAYNRITNVMTGLEDGAGIYTLGHFANAVNISGNYICTSLSGLNAIPSQTSKLGWAGGIYLDEGTWKVNIRGNVVEECYQWLNARIGAAVRDITASGNYSDVPVTRTNSGNNAFDSTNVKVSSHKVMSDGAANRPAAAQSIVESAGARR